MRWRGNSPTTPEARPTSEDPPRRTILTIPAAVYSAFMFVSAGLFARAMYRRNAAAPAASYAAGETTRA